MNLCGIEKINDDIQLSEECSVMKPSYCLKDFGEDNLNYAVLSLLVSNPLLKVQIEQMFNCNRSKYILAAQEHAYYKDIMNSFNPVDRIELGLKLLGLFAVEGEKVILRLIKKGWPRLFRCLERLRIKKDLSALEKWSHSIDSNFYEILILFIYYANIYDMPMKDDPIDIDLKDDDNVALVFKNIVYPQGDCKQVTVPDNLLSIFKSKLGISPGNFNQVGHYFKNFGLGMDPLDNLMRYVKAAGINPALILNSEIEPELMNRIINIAAGDFLVNGKKLEDVIMDIMVAVFIAYIGQEYHKLKADHFNKKEEKTDKELRKEVEKAVNEIARLEEELSKKEKLASELGSALQQEKNKNRKMEARAEKEYKDMLKEAEYRCDQQITALEKDNKMLQDMISDLIKTEETVPEEGALSFDEMLQSVRQTSGILYVCKEGSGASLAKLQRLGKLADNIKFYTSETDSVPSDISYIFFDYHLMNHGIYYKIKGIGKRGNIPLHYIHSLQPEKNIEEMYGFIKEHKEQ